MESVGASVNLSTSTISGCADGYGVFEEEDVEVLFLQRPGGGI